MPTLVTQRLKQCSMSGTPEAPVFITAMLMPAPLYDMLHVSTQDTPRSVALHQDVSSAMPLSLDLAQAHEHNSASNMPCKEMHVKKPLVHR